MTTNPPPGPEYLEQGGGRPLGPGSGDGRRGGLRKPLLIGGLVVAGLVAVGGAVFAVQSFLSEGAQPAEALPAGTLGYVSINLDPAGAQKIEAVRTLNKFPAFKDELGLDTDDDVRSALFEEVLGGECAGVVDYAKDIEPWLGDRMAAAAVPKGEDDMSGVMVLEISDADAARAGLAKLGTCEEAGPLGVAVEGDWAIVAETDAIAAQVAKDGAADSLADDVTYQKWTDESGDSGIVSVYASPAGGRFLAGELSGLTGLDDTASGEDSLSGARTALEDFQGMGAIVRFNDGALEVEVAGDPGGSLKTLAAGTAGDDVLASLPADTAAALGVGLADGWVTQLADQLAAAAGSSMGSRDLFDELSAATGLSLPEDLETLSGDSMALAVGGDVDLEGMSGPEELPVAVKIKGDPAEIEAVLEKVRAQVPADVQAFIESQSGEGVVVVGPMDGYREQLLTQGELGGSDTFRGVVPEATDASAILYLDFDASDGWLVELLADSDPQTADNLEPLSAFGVSAWQADGIAHARLRITTD